MERKIKNPVWADDRKQRIFCTFEYIKDNNIRRVNATVAKMSEGSDKINPDWTEILENYSEEDIDTRTQEEVENHRASRQHRNEERRRQHERNIQESLFETKLKMFQIDDIIGCDDIEKKSAIRKAKTNEEVFVRVVQLLVSQELKNMQSNTDIESS